MQEGGSNMMYSVDEGMSGWSPLGMYMYVEWMMVDPASCTKR